MKLKFNLNIVLWACEDCVHLKRDGKTSKCTNETRAMNHSQHCLEYKPYERKKL